jgi:CheY-like chemotaxis protein
MCILLVDDESQFRAAVSEYLRLHGYEVIEAHDAKHALTIAAQIASKITVVVTDIEMPEMDGVLMWDN